MNRTDIEIMKVYYNELKNYLVAQASDSQLYPIQKELERVNKWIVNKAKPY